MTSTTTNLHTMATCVDMHGIHRGDQFAQPGNLPLFDISALAYLVAENVPAHQAPGVFFTDECASIALIESSEQAMTVIRAISAALDTDPCETDGKPDYIEHVSNWAATPAPFETQPPTTSEVIGCILRAAQAQHTAPNAA
ncbi:hypothetical protein [Streptomyces bluensis]|uniref:Uncharacterized protein n=1 Tax=Streptomyces bluensis TaxID=33897 RepID=A0ABW6UUA8_9ACTN